MCASCQFRTPSIARTLSRRINVEADVDGRDLGSAVAEVESALDEIEFPLGYHAELLGEYAERQAAHSASCSPGWSLCLVIFFLLTCPSGSWRLAVMSFLSLPLALVGGVLAAYLQRAACSRSVRWLDFSPFWVLLPATASC